MLMTLLDDDEDQRPKLCTDFLQEGPSSYTREELPEEDDEDKE